MSLSPTRTMTQGSIVTLSMPHLLSSIECDIDSLRLKALGAQLKQDLNANVSASDDDQLIRSVALALHDVSEANARWDGASRHRDIRVVADEGKVDISVAVKAATPNRHWRGIAGIDVAVQPVDLAGRSRDGKLKLHEYKALQLGTS